jgi:hypothetical protein
VCFGILCECHSAYCVVFFLEHAGELRVISLIEESVLRSSPACSRRKNILCSLQGHE